MDACVITEDDHGFEISGNGGPNYLIFDGFTLTSPDQVQYGQGFEIANFTNNNALCCHHIWVVNNIVSGYGQAGFQGGQADFVYVIHNTFYNNAAAPGCDAGSQGSGISMGWPIALSGYTYAADDKSNAVTGNLASQGDYFRQVYSWNIAYNNHVAGCSPATDGNGIIMDTWNGTPGVGPGVYARQALISFNLVYNNGGQGIKLTSMDNGTGTPGVGVTVANNTSFNNTLDPTSRGGAEIWEQGGSNDTFVNNVAYASRTTSGAQSNNNDYIGDSSGGFASHWSNNVGYCTNWSGPCYGVWYGAVWTSGKDPANPLWVNAGNTSLGSETTPPVGTNFALQSGSPAIGYGQLSSYLPPSAIDAGACSSTFSTCP
jgi:hypothetical protein